MVEKKVVDKADKVVGVLEDQDMVDKIGSGWHVKEVVDIPL